MPINDLDSQDVTVYNVYLNDLADVVTPTPLDGMILSWSDISGWVAIPFSSITGAPSSLDGLTDTSINLESVNQSLVFNGGTWVNSGLLLANITNVGSPTASGQALVWNGLSYVFANPSGAGGSSTLSGLNDTLVTSVSPGNSLIYNGITWTNSGIRVENLTNVSAPVSSGQALTWNGVSYVFATPTGTAGVTQFSALSDTSVAGSGAGSILEAVGNKWVASNTLNSIKQSYLTGIYDITYNGVSNLGIDVTTALQTVLTNVPNGSTVRVPGGDYYISNTLLISGKRDLCFDISPNARFIETKRLGSGTFIMRYCSGISWYGGQISGADTLSFILGFASGVEFSGSSMENFSPSGIERGESVRYVLGQGLSLDFCGNMVIKDLRIINKYRAVTDYFGVNLLFDNIQHYGVHRGALSRLDESIVFGATGGFPNTGTASAQLGDIYKETERTTYSFNIGKSTLVRVNNCFSENGGGFLNAGTPSLGGGGSAVTENVNITNCYSHNPYDNGIYLSSVHRCLVDNMRVITDSNLPTTTTAIKGRGSYIVFSNCYVEHSYNGYGFEGYGNTADYWTAGGSNGWSSEGCMLINSVARDCKINGVFADRNNTIYPRDITIQGNYFYNCGLGPHSPNPSGYFLGLSELSVVPIVMADVRRVRIINNTIENTGVVGPDYAMTIGVSSLGASVWITGAEVCGNKILGVKNGIHAIRVSNARIADNWGERIGQYGGGPYVTASGYPAMVIAEGMKDSRIYGNMLAPTGHCASVFVVPNTTFTNVMRRDNDGDEVIN